MRSRYTRKMRAGCTRVRLLGTAMALAALLGAQVSPGAPAPQHSLLGAGLPAASLGGPCLESGKAYLRAHIRGAIRLDVDLHGPLLACEGGPRLDGSGIRVGFEGRVGPGPRRMRMVFGIDGAHEGRPGRELRSE